MAFSLYKLKALYRGRVSSGLQNGHGESLLNDQKWTLHTERSRKTRGASGPHLLSPSRLPSLSLAAAHLSARPSIAAGDARERFLSSRGLGPAHCPSHLRTSETEPSTAARRPPSRCHLSAGGRPWSALSGLPSIPIPTYTPLEDAARSLVAP